MFDPEVYKKMYLQDGKLPEDYPLYLVKIKNDEVEDEKVSHNLITILYYIAATNWYNNEWSINQINEF